MEGTRQHGSIINAGIIALAGLMLAAAIAYGLSAVGSGLEQRSANEVTVTGSARTHVRADRAMWTIHASGQADTITTAIQQANGSLESVRQFLVAGGLTADEIALDALSTSVNYVWMDGTYTSEVASYSAYRTLTVRSDDVDLVSRLSIDLGSLLETGVIVTAYNPEYYVTTLPDLRPQLLNEAVADAKVRAEAMLEVVDGTVTTVRSMRAGPFQVSTPDSVDVSDYGMYDTSTIDKTVTATVSVTFGTA